MKAAASICMVSLKDSIHRVQDILSSETTTVMQINKQHRRYALMSGFILFFSQGVGVIHSEWIPFFLVVAVLWHEIRFTAGGRRFIPGQICIYYPPQSVINLVMDL